MEIKIPAIKIIVSELNNMQAIENPKEIFDIKFDALGDLTIDWKSRKASVLIINLSHMLKLDYKKDFKFGRNSIHHLSDDFNSEEKILKTFSNILQDYIEIAEIFTK